MWCRPLFILLVFSLTLAVHQYFVTPQRYYELELAQQLEKCYNVSIECLSISLHDKLVLAHRELRGLMQRGIHQARSSEDALSSEMRRVMSTGG